MALSNRATPIEYGKFRRQVLNGEIPVSIEVSLEMQRIEALIANPDYYYDDKAIEGFVKFCENEMTLTNGDPIRLTDAFKLWAEQLLAWYHFPIESRYDEVTKQFVQKRVKKRLTNKQYLIVARGAAKSMYISLIQMYFLIIDTESTHQITTAPTMKQSEEVMQPIRTAMVKARGPLFKFLTDGSINNTTGSIANRVKIASTKKGIENFMTNSLLEIRPMSVNKLQGLRCKIASLDEWLSGILREDPIGAIEQGASKLADYVILAVSSEGTVRGGVGDEIKMELARILRGEYHAPHVSIWHYKLDDKTEVGNPDMWVKANPNLGKTVQYDTYQRDVERMESEPATRNDILAKRFGIPTEGFTYFFTYEQCMPHKKQDFTRQFCSMGADLSHGDDFCAFTFLFPLGNGLFGVKCRSYVSETKVRQLPAVVQQKYDTFVEEDSLRIMPGSILDMMDVYDDLETFIIKNQYEVVTMGYDPYNAKAFVERWIREYSSFGVVKVIQGAKTESVPLGELRKLAHHRMLIFDEAIMKFAMENTIAIEDTNGNRKLNKYRAEDKIDNMAALMDAWVAYTTKREAFD